MSVQTGEDNQDGDAQTEPIITEERWVQWPPEDLKGWGRGGDPGRYEEEEAEEGGRVSFGMEGESALRLISFLKKAGQVSAMCSVMIPVYDVLVMNVGLFCVTGGKSSSSWSVSIPVHTIPIPILF